MKIFLHALLIVLFFAGSAEAQLVWQKRGGPHGGSITTIEISPIDANKIYIITENSRQAYRSNDNAVNWTLLGKLNPANDNERIVDLEIDYEGYVYAVSDYDNFYVSGDDGATWTKVNTGTDFTDGGFSGASALELNYTAGSLLIVGESLSVGQRTIYVSDDFGVTWQIGGDVPVADDIVTANYGLEGMIFVYSCCGSAKVYASEDGGYSFYDVCTSTNLADFDIEDMVVSADRTKVYLSTRTGIYEWDGGNVNNMNWNDITGTIAGFFSNENKLAIGTLGGVDYLFFGDYSNKTLYRKDLSTGTWFTMSNTFSVKGHEPYDFVAKSNQQAFVANRFTGFFKTTNGGSAWTEANKGIENQRFSDLILSANGFRTIVAAENHIYTSDNDGTSWDRFDLTGGGYNSISNFFRLDNGDIYGYGSVAVKSTDGGVNWSSIANPFGTSPVRHARNSDQTRFFALSNVSNNAFAYSANAGTSWSAAITPTGLPSSYYIEDFYVSSTHVVYANVRDFDTGGRNKLYKITFAPSPAPGPPTSASATLITTTTPGYTISTNNFESVALYNDKIYALGRNGSGNWVLCVSSDAGATFTSKSIPQGGYNMSIASNGYIFIAYNDNSDNQIFSLSRDGGDTWVSTALGSAYKGYLVDLELNADGYAYALMDFYGLYKTTTTVIIPSPPTNLVEVGKNATGLSLRWVDNSTTEQQFVIEKEVDGVYVMQDQDGGSTTEVGKKYYYHDRFLTPNTTYNYKVYAQNPAGKSSALSISVTTLAQTTPSIPDNRSWSGVTGNVDGLGAPATNTSVSIKHISGGRYSISDVTGGLLNSIIGATTYAANFYESSGQTYFESNQGKLVPQQNGTWNGTNQIVLYWRVNQGYDNAYPDKYEKFTLTLNPTDPVPGIPTNVRALVYSNTSIEVSWTGTQFEQEFIIERAVASGGPFTEVGRVNYPATTYIDANSLVAATTYFYRVKGSNSTGASAVSAVSAGVTFGTPKFVLSNSVMSTASAGNATGYIWGDYDNDGDEDAVLIQLTFFNAGATIPYAFRNDGGGNFTAVNAGFESSNYLIGTTADYDNDGKLDIFMTTTSAENLLYKGNGNFTFTKVDPNPLAENSPDFESSSISATWVDYDKNGRLDMFMAFQNQVNTLYSQSATGEFTKITDQELVMYVAQSSSHSWADYDNDGDQDVFIIDNSGPTTPNRLYKNNSDGTFSRVTGLIFDTDLDMNGFSTSWGDYDNDGDLDLFMGVQEDDGLAGSGNVIYRNSGSAGGYTFSKPTLAPVTDTKSYQTFGSTWGDIDNDGDLDLLTSNNSFEGANSMPNGIFLNNGSGAFTQVTNEKFNDPSSSNFGISLADYDKDGFLDAAVAVLSPATLQFGFPAPNSQLFKNNTPASASRNWVQFKLVGTASNASAVGARITVVAGGKTQIRDISTNTGFAAGNSLIAHFGLGAATSITSLQVRWPNGAVHNFTGYAINQIHTITEDAVGPVPSTLVPAHNAPAASVATPLAIEFAESSTAVAAKKIYLYKANDLVTPVFSADVTSATKTSVGQGHRYQFAINPALQASTSYVVYVDAGAFVDTFGNASAAIGAGGWAFVTADDIAPMITFTPVTSVAKGFGTANSSATVTDNVGVTSVVVKIRKIGGSAYSDLVATAGASNAWTVTLTEATHFDGTGTEFYIEAKDAANNIARSPVTGTHKIYLSYTGTQAAIPGNHIGIGGQVTNWKAFSIPFVLNSPANAVTAVFEELDGKENKVDFRLITYGSATAWAEYPNDFSIFERGKGYFINVKTDPGIIDLPVDLNAPTNDRSNLYQMTLKPGWNMIGNPYLSSINWSDVKTYNAAVTGQASIGQLNKFTGSGYSTSTQVLEAYEGAFVNNSGSSAVTFDIPFEGQTTPGGRIATDELGTDINQESWMTPIHVRQKEFATEIAGIGMTPNAKSSIDEYDGVTPPRFFSYLEVNFDHPEHFQKRFTRDIVPTSSSHEWIFNVSSNIDGDAVLYWDDAALQGAKDMFLLDISRQTLVNMKETGSYSFNPKESANFKIYFGENLKIAPEKVILGKAFPNPTSGLTSLSFSLPESGGLNQTVTLEIVDGMGKSMGAIAQGRFNPGYHVINWDARELNNGFYTYRLTVNSINGRTTHVNKLIIK